MNEAATFYTVVMDEAYRDPRVAAILVAAGGVFVIVVMVLIWIIGAWLSQVVRDC